jgi:hypothetical protein
LPRYEGPQNEEKTYGEVRKLLPDDYDNIIFFKRIRFDELLYVASKLLPWLQFDTKSFLSQTTAKYPTSLNKYFLQLT